MNGKILFAAVLSAMTMSFAASAFDAGTIKKADDRAANWLIEQYNFKTGQFKGEQPDLLKFSIIITAFCRHPHDYKEVAGPWVTGPVKYIVSQVKDDGSVATPGSDEWQTLAWVLTALKSTANPKYEPLITKLRARMNDVAGGKDMHGKWKTDEFTVTLDGESLRKQLAHIQMLEKAKTKEVELDGKKIMWAQALAENVIKLQQPNGSFGPDLELNALAIEVLNHCFKQYEDDD